MRMIFAAVTIAAMPGLAFAQSAELPSAQAAVEQILNDPAKQKAYCEALKLSEKISEEEERIEDLGDKATPADVEQSAELRKSYGEEAQKLWHEIDVDYSEISRATSFAALVDPQSKQPYPGAEKFLADQQEMNGRCHREASAN
jgi:hypothetical protein